MVPPLTLLKKKDERILEKMKNENEKDWKIFGKETCPDISRMGNMAWVGLMGMEVEIRKLLGTEMAFFGGVWILLHDIPASLHSSTDFALYLHDSCWFQATGFDFSSLG